MARKIPRCRTSLIWFEVLVVFVFVCCFVLFFCPAEIAAVPVLGVTGAAKEEMGQLQVYISRTQICFYVDAELQWIMPAVVTKVRKATDRKHEIISREETLQQLRKEKGFFPHLLLYVILVAPSFSSWKNGLDTYGWRWMGCVTFICKC